VAANAAAKPTAWLTLFAISSPGDGERSREAGALAIAFIIMEMGPNVVFRHDSGNLLEQCRVTR